MLCSTKPIASSADGRHGHRMIVPQQQPQRRFALQPIVNNFQQNEFPFPRTNPLKATTAVAACNINMARRYNENATGPPPPYVVVNTNTVPTTRKARHGNESTQNQPWQLPQRQGGPFCSEWLALPVSSYKNIFDLSSARTACCDHQQPSPFETKMNRLFGLLKHEYKSGASLVYTREIFEPSDADFHFGARIDVTQLSSDQVNRLGLMILGPELEQTLIAYMTFCDHLASEDTSNGTIEQVFDHFFDDFKVKYGKVRKYEEKFCRLFSFTYALNRYNKWIYLERRACSRQKLVEALALRWKNLLADKSSTELGIDAEFSYPAVIALLLDFQRRIEQAPTFGDPPLLFKFN